MLSKAGLLAETAVVAGSVWVGWEALSYGFGSGKEPGPGSFPFLVACLIGLAATLTALRTAAAPRSRAALCPPDAWAHWPRSLAVWLALVGWLLLAKPAGAVLATFAMVVVTARMMGATIRLALPLGAGMALGVWLVFGQWLRVGLPLWPAVP